jgi:hypothetical protein
MAALLAAMQVESVNFREEDGGIQEIGRQGLAQYSEGFEGRLKSFGSRE